MSLTQFHQAQTASDKRSALQAAIASDARVVCDPQVKAWLATRWRQLFVQAAANDAQVIKRVKSPIGLRRDQRSARQKVAERFLLDASPSDYDPDCLSAPTRAPRATLMFCPGFINGLLPVHGFGDAFPALVAEGWHIVSADAHPVRSCEANVADLQRTISEGYGYWPTPDSPARTGEMQHDIILFGYSKGGPDMLSLLAAHPELKPRIKAVFTWAGANGGSFTADKIYQLIKDLPLNVVSQRLHDFLRLLMPGMKRDGRLRRLEEYDMIGGVKSLTTTDREAFLAAQGANIDALGIPLFCLTAATKLLEVPTIQMADWLALSKHCANNDMQVTQAQASLELPMATSLAVLHGHHWDVSYPPFPRHMRIGSPNLDHPFPRQAAVMAIGQLCVELGLA